MRCKTLIKSNLDLIGADEKLIEATERLASVIVGQALGQEFDKGLEAGKTGLMKGPSSRQDFIDANLKDMGFIGISSAGEVLRREALLNQLVRGQHLLWEAILYQQARQLLYKSKLFN